MTFKHLNEGTWIADGVAVSAMRVRHPSFTVGYRLEAGGRSMCYIPDNELVGGSHETAKGWRARLLQFCGGTDLLVHDAMFTDEEYRARTGWGHSTFQQALDLAAEAGVARLMFFHHAPERVDDKLAEIVDRRREEAATRGLSPRRRRRRRRGRDLAPVGEDRREPLPIDKGHRHRCASGRLLAAARRTPGRLDEGMITTGAKAQARFTVLAAPGTAPGVTRDLGHEVDVREVAGPGEIEAPDTPAVLLLSTALLSQASGGLTRLPETPRLRGNRRRGPRCGREGWAALPVPE